MKFVTVKIWQPTDEPYLAGRIDGRRALVRLLEAVPQERDTLLVIVDFLGVELATSSFLSESVLRLRDHLRLGGVATYLAVANLSELVAEEFDDLLRRAGDALVACEMGADDQPVNGRLIGRLDPKLAETLELLAAKGEASAVDLHGVGDRGIGPTAWNNRLSSLAAKSLVEEIPSGRSKKYRPLLGVV